MKKNILAYVLIFSVLSGGVSFAQDETISIIEEKSKIQLFWNGINNGFSKIKLANFNLKRNNNDEEILLGAGAPITDSVSEESIQEKSIETISQNEIKNSTETKQEKKQDYASDKNEKKSFWAIFKKKEIIEKNEPIKEISDTQSDAILKEEANNANQEISDLDNISKEKQDAIQEANSNLLGDYFSTPEAPSDNLVEGQVQKENTSALQEEQNTQKIEGTISETIILSLDDCIKQALANNPQIRSAFSNSEIYKTKIGQAWSNYFPTFNMTNGYTRNRFLSINFPVPEQEYDFFNAMDTSASMLLFDFGKTKALADMSKRTYESTIANLDETINTIVYDVKEAYYALLHALEKQNVYQDSVNSYELQLKQAEAFYNIGTKPRIDVTMAQYNLGNAQLGYVKASNEVTLAVARLNNAMGLPDKESYKILDKLVMDKYQYDFDMVLEKAYATRPELLAYRKKAKASEILIRSTKRAFLPNIEAVGAFQVGGGSEFTDDYGWTVGAQFVYGNTNLWLLKKQVDEAKATHQKDLADLQVMEQNVYLQVKQAHVNLKNAHESIPITALSLKHAKEQFDLASGRYKAGVGDAIELKDSEITYRNARLDYLAALLQYNVSVADLERVIGAQLQKIEEEKECEAQK